MENFEWELEKIIKLKYNIVGEIFYVTQNRNWFIVELNSGSSLKLFAVFFKV